MTLQPPPSSPEQPSAIESQARPIEPAISVITLAVADLERAVRFYRDGLGWPTRGIVGADLTHGAVAFFELGGGLKLALWPQPSLDRETGASRKAVSQEAKEVSVPRTLLSHNVPSAERVSEVLARALRAGARCVRAPYAPVWGGLVTFFADPDGHLWEIAWNPAWTPCVQPGA